MKHAILRYGTAGAALLLVLSLLPLVLFGLPGPEDFGWGEVVGYATIVVSLVPVILGIRYYRDHAGAPFTFGRALLVGLGITTFPSIAFAVYNFVYVTVIDPDFGQKFWDYTLEQAERTMAPAEYQAYAAGLAAQQALYFDPWIQSIVMFLTVFVVGAALSIVAAFWLRRTGAGVAGAN